MPFATGLAANLAEAFGVEPELISGGGGILDIKVDDELVWSKFDKGEFPVAGEVERIIRSR
ncbi:MAG: hypothetical protein HOM34_06475 [Planctomycetes bacterium]|nr:hypothetical protein [Planctomycetota bacterium]MBT4028688.1 hypothetical protein [Planctomycetota bacterium]MBT4560098.1 hypothetical protein [Planctomycetota bacterium]MBT5102254.1 hypothetical protein [Planctomycetota bacterium]MBT5120351.1 hypothetical protein [Planctomycetota bacterium]